MILENLIFPYDYILLAIISIVVIFCLLKGFIQSILSLLTWVGSILITIYSYQSLSDFLNKQFLNINFLSKYEYLTTIGSLIISVPIIFIISLFILKRIRKILSSDLDKQILGVMFDKFFGIIYGLIFSYIIITSMIILLQRFELKSLEKWITENSTIILEIKNTNIDYLNLGNEINKINVN